ncbi:MAG: hypothetical protein ACK5LO_06255 [Leucobacter sp.]
MTTVVQCSDQLDFATHLSGVGTPEQRQVVVICTIAPGERQPGYDPEAISQALPEVRVVVVPSHLTRALKERLGDDLNVFNGAARVYPVRDGAAHYRSFVQKAIPRKRTKEHREALAKLIAEARFAQGRLTRAQATPRTAAVPSARDASAAVSRRTPPAVVPREPMSAEKTPRGSTFVSTPADIRGFVQHLLSEERRLPVALVTHRAGPVATWVDTERIARELAGLAEVYEMSTGEATWEFARELADYPGAECYGGACRVYGLGTEWAQDPSRSPLRFVFTKADGEQVTGLIIADALKLAFASGYASEAAPHAERVSGTVKGTVSGRGAVELDRGGYATIWPELTAPGIEAEQLVVAGMRVEGVLDVESHRLDVRAMLRSAQRLTSAYRPGDQLPTRVVAVEADFCVVEIVPDFQVCVVASDIVDTVLEVDLRDWISVGEVLNVTVLETGRDDDDWRVSVREVDGDRPVQQAPALLQGGPPWLQAVHADRVQQAAPEPAPAARAENSEDRRDLAESYADAVGVREVEEADGSSDSAAVERARLRVELETLRSERDALARELSKRSARLENVEAELRKRKTEARKLSNDLTRAKRRTAGIEHVMRDHESDLRAFGDPAEQLSYEVMLEWTRRTPASEKAGARMSEYAFLDGFIQTVQEAGPRERAKIVDVMVEILTGRVHEVASRRTHQLRTGTGGDDPYYSRADGATCWRVAIHYKTPQALQMHYWQRSDGHIEFSSVRKHDDMRP